MVRATGIGSRPARPVAHAPDRGRRSRATTVLGLPTPSESPLEALSVSAVAVAIAEIGDKTQVATVVLAARYEFELLMVVAGTTLGMLAANMPVLFGGQALLRRIPMHWVHRAASGLFLLLALITAWHG